MAGALKKTTGLTGLAVAKDPHKTLGVVYQKILSVLKKMPENATYRRSTQAIIEERLQAVKSEPDTAKLEAKISCGQIEEVIHQAERELYLARRMLEWRAWEPLTKEAPPNQWKWPI